MRVININPFSNNMSNPIYSFDCNSKTKSINFSAKPVYEPNQVLPETEKLILKATKKVKAEKEKIINALNKTWKQYALGKKSDIYIGHRELPLDKNQMDWMHLQIQLTGDLPNKERVYFAETEPKHFFIHINSTEEHINPTNKDISYDIDFRNSVNGKIEETASDSASETTSDNAKIEQLNQKVQYYLKAVLKGSTRK